MQASDNTDRAQPFTSEDLAWGERVVQRLHGVRGYEAWAELLAKERAALAALPPLRAREEIARTMWEHDHPGGDWKAAHRSELYSSAPYYSRADTLLSSTAGQEWRDISSAPKDQGETWEQEHSRIHSIAFDAVAEALDLHAPELDDKARVLVLTSTACRVVLRLATKHPTAPPVAELAAKPMADQIANAAARHALDGAPPVAEPLLAEKSEVK